MKTPMHASNPLSKDKLGKSIDHMICRGMVGLLLYLTTNIPNIMYSICLRALDFSLIIENHILNILKGSYAYAI